MKSKKKFLAITLTLVLIASTITSCDMGGKDKPEDIISLAEQNLDGAAYTVDISTVFTTEDEDIKDTVAALAPTMITYSVNGDCFIITMNSTVGGFSLDKSYTVVDDTLYHKSTASLGDKTVTVQEKSPIGLADRAMLISDAGVAASLGDEDFKTANAEKTQNGYTITCTEIKDDALTGLATILASSFEGTDAVVNIGNVSYVIGIANAAFTKTTLTCSYKVKMNDVEYDLTMTMTSIYDFANTPTVSAPADAEAYTETTYDKIVK